MAAAYDCHGSKHMFMATNQTVGAKLFFKRGNSLTNNLITIGDTHNLGDLE